MSIKPILFNQEMTKAILEGGKTVTRRLVKPQPEGKIYTGYCTESTMRNDKTVGCFMFGDDLGEIKIQAKPPYQTGDILYVRETQSIHRVNDKGNKFVRVHYKADDAAMDFKVSDSEWYRLVKYDYTDEQFISPYWTTKETCRIFLKVTDIRVERLQDITEEQEKAEGCIDFNDKIGNSKFDDVMEFDLTARDAFAELWDSTVKEDWQKFASSPWVWVIEFERCERPEGWC